MKFCIYICRDIFLWEIIEIEYQSFDFKINKNIILGNYLLLFSISVSRTEQKIRINLIYEYIISDNAYSSKSIM